MSRHRRHAPRGLQLFPVKSFPCHQGRLRVIGPGALVASTPGHGFCRRAYPNFLCFVFCLKRKGGRAVPGLEGGTASRSIATKPQALIPQRSSIKMFVLLFFVIDPFLSVVDYFGSRSHSRALEHHCLPVGWCFSGLAL